MKFQPGHKFAKGGARPGAGRKSKQQKKEIKRAEEIAREYIEKNIDPVLETYIALAAGQVVMRETPEGKKEFTLSVNPRTTIDAISKFVPPAKQTIAVEHEGLEELMRKAKERRGR